MVLKLAFIEDFDGNLVLLVVDIVGQEYFSKRSISKDFSIVVNVIILFKFFSSLFLTRFQNSLILYVFSFCTSLFVSHLIYFYS